MADTPVLPEWLEIDEHLRRAILARDAERRATGGAPSLRPAGAPGPARPLPPRAGALRPADRAPAS